MLEQERITDSATLPFLEWLIDAGPDVPEVIRNRFRGELFASPHAAFVGVVLAFALDVSALALTGQRAFVLVLALEASLAVVRWLFIRGSMRAAARAARMPTDFAIALTMLWHTLQGAAALLAMRSGNGSLQVLASTIVMGLQGQVCTKHFAAPRLVQLLVALSVGPFLIGALLSGDLPLLLLFLFLPAYTFGNLGLASRYRVRAISSLRGQYDGQHRSRHDPLTGLCNRLGLFEQLGGCSGHSQEEYAVFYLDLDGFKTVNDLLGHRRGDELLVAVADKLRSLVRTRDLVARLGGDEFIVVARAIDPEEARLLGERIVFDLTNAMQDSSALSGLGLGVSVGYACCPEDGEDGAVLLDLADGGLYAAKAGGKGCCRRYEARADQSRACSKQVREECFGFPDEFKGEIADTGCSSTSA